MKVDEKVGGDVVSEGKYVFCSACQRPKSECAARRGNCRSAPAVYYKAVAIPDDRQFLRQWFIWVRGKVSRRFKRDRERIPDTTQRVCARLLQKEFTARWFFKHLKDEYVTRSEGERILGDGIAYSSPRRKNGRLQTHRSVQLTFMSGVGEPVAGKRSDPNSIWRLSDILKYGKFDFDRYFYSTQSHTIDSDRVLRYLGYEPGSYSVLQSLWRQDRLLPHELTEHECPRKKVTRAGNKAPPSTCPECSRGLALLRSKGITLDMVNYPSWEDPKIVDHVRKMRWNDSQLVDFLRRWQEKNEVYAQPTYIMRQVAAPDEKPHGIDAGLLKYAERIIDNEVVNDFKHLSRTDDMAKMIYNGGMSSGEENADTMAFDPDSEDGAQKVVCDSDAVEGFRGVEHRSDVTALLSGAVLSKEEMDVMSAVELMDVTVREYARQNGMVVSKVHKIRASAIRKLRSAVVGSSQAERVMQDVCERHGVTADAILGPDLFGAPVLARTELFSSLYVAGMSEEDISEHFDYPREKVAAAVLRAGRSSET